MGWLQGFASVKCMYLRNNNWISERVTDKVRRDVVRMLKARSYGIELYRFKSAICVGGLIGSIAGK